jgi:hypothetical protein
MTAAVPRMRIQLWCCFGGRSTGVSLISLVSLVSIGLSTVRLRDVSAVSANVLLGVTRRGRVCEYGHLAETSTTTTIKLMLISRFIIP